MPKVDYIHSGAMKNYSTKTKAHGSTTYYRLQRYARSLSKVLNLSISSLGEAVMPNFPLSLSANSQSCPSARGGLA
jgi:hypothetical protein